MTNLNKEIIKESVSQKIKTVDSFVRLKRQLVKKTKQADIPSNISLFKTYNQMVEKKEIVPSDILKKLLQKNKVRSLSGVSIITCVTKEFPCPGKCIYCPEEKGMPKSYLSNEPAIMRAILADFDPKKQVEIRLKALTLQGHPTDKIELIILGGTFSALPKKYQEKFIKECLDGLNNKNSKNLEAAKKINEKVKSRCIGLTIETRPDWIDSDEIKWLRRLGVTRVEIGVQSIFDDILKINKRGHKVQDTIKATKLLKDAGLKIGYHMMPNLYGSDFKKDLLMFKELFNNNNFKPDYLKIYPCMVMKNTKLYELWEEGKYKPYSTKKLTSLILEIKKNIPYYVRINRLIRDIPASSIVAGSKVTNLRQLLEKELKDEDIECHCIRCREIKDVVLKEKPQIFREDYQASQGKEIFLSYETKKRDLLALLRLRIPENKNKEVLPVLKKVALIRELHTYGPQVSIDKKERKAIQHKGLGERLIKEAEKIVKEEFGFKKIAIIAGVGVREYYKKLGYKLEQEYMVKNLP